MTQDYLKLKQTVEDTDKNSVYDETLRNSTVNWFENKKAGKPSKKLHGGIIITGVAIVALAVGIAIPRGDSDAKTHAYESTPDHVAMSKEVSIDPIYPKDPESVNGMRPSDGSDQVGQIKDHLNALVMMANQASNKVELALKETESLQVENKRLADILSDKESELMAFKTTLAQYDKQQSTLEDENNTLRNQNGKLLIEISNLRTASKTRAQGKLVLEPEDKIAITSEAESEESQEEPKKPVNKNKPETAKKKLVRANKTAKSTDGLKGLSIIGATNQMLVAMQNGNPVSIPVGKQWHGINFESVDTAKGLVHTSVGDLKISQ